MGYAWKITLNSVDISDKVSRFSIACSIESFCREMTLDISAPDLYAELDFSQVSESPEIEILTKTGETWISQGEFFIERPALAGSIQSDLMQGVWGRSLTAKLAEPFAPKITKAWEERTTFFGICEEMCGLAGFEWDPAYSEINDFVIYPYTYEAEGGYPIEVISELAKLAGALVTTDRLGHLCIKQVEYSPSAADVTITDADIAGITESPEWPAFANRVRITPTGPLAGYSVQLTVPEPCIQADGVARTKLFARVTDSDGEPVDDLVVDWEENSDSSALAWEKTNTREIVIHDEAQRADDFYTVKVEFAPKSVDGIYAYADTARQNNFAPGGYEINGNAITLTNKLDYCDQSLLITYRVGGVAVNYLQAGNEAEDVTVTANIEGQQDSGVVYIDNPCECPPVIRLTAAPTSIHPRGSASLIVYAEESGPITTGRMVFMAEVSATKRGALSWTTARLGTVDVANEETIVINEISGVSQCEVSMFPESVTAVYVADENGSPTGGNLYSSHNGKVIDLTEVKTTGTKLLINYSAQGAALNHFTGSILGAATINAYMLTNREQGAEASVNIRVVDNTETTDDYPSTWIVGEGDGDYGGVGGDDEEGYDPSYESEPGAEFNWCVPDSVSDDPNNEALAARFATALEHDCECEVVCEAEFDIYGTIQSYDEASGRTIAEIVIEDYELEDGSPEYWEKYAELKAEAFEKCAGECAECADVEPVTWDDESTPETIVAGSSIQLFVLDGKAPFVFSTESTGYYFDAELTQQSIETTERNVTLYCAAGT